MAILVVGDIILDKYIIGKVNRISPEAPVPIVHVQTENYVLGGSANVAHNLAKLDVETHIFGTVGEDENGKIIEKQLKDNNIIAYLQKSPLKPTTSKIRIIGEKQQIVRVDYEDTICKIEPDIDYLLKIINANNYSVIVISDYNKGLCSTDLCEFIVKYAIQNNIITIVDPKGKDWSKYNGAFCITPNLKELQDVGERTVLGNFDEEILQISYLVKEKYNLRNIVITRSEKGISYIGEDNQIAHYPTYAKEVFDVSGAGDTVVAIIAKYLAEGLPFEEVIPIANIGAGYVVSKLGTYAISDTELLNEILGKSD